MWKDIFERCLSPDLLARLTADTALFQPSDGGGASTSRPPAPPAPPTPRQRWKHAVATIVSYLYPPGVCDQIERRLDCAVEFVIRPQADALLLTDQLVLQHAPLLSPVLPEPIKDNQSTHAARPSLQPYAPQPATPCTPSLQALHPRASLPPLKMDQAAVWRGTQGGDHPRDGEITRAQAGRRALDPHV